MPHVGLIGAGIVGLTTALEIQAKGYDVTIFADRFPGDEKNAQYTSPWAGAHHLSLVGDDPAKLEFERQTFEYLWAQSANDKEEGRCLMRTRHKEYYEYDATGKTQLEHMPDFRELGSDELIPGAASGVTFTTITIDPASYLPFLLARFLGRGGHIRRVHVQHIDQVLLGAWGTPVPDALVVCPGIGARTLGGVEDRDVYPVRGQTVLVRAPWLRESKGFHKKDGGDDVTYVIPRPSGDVVLGGTRGAHDWYPHPRPETARGILTRAVALMPELAANVDDVESLVVEHGCGLRPARKGGIRLEHGSVCVAGDGGAGRQVPVVYNYGHGGAGYQSSWGTAVAAATLLEQVLTPD